MRQDIDCKECADRSNHEVLTGEIAREDSQQRGEEYNRGALGY